MKFPSFSIRHLIRHKFATRHGYVLVDSTTGCPDDVLLQLEHDDGARCVLMDRAQTLELCALLFAAAHEIQQEDAATLLETLGAEGFRVIGRKRLEELLDKERGYDAIEAQSAALFGPDGEFSPGGPCDE